MQHKIIVISSEHGEAVCRKEFDVDYMCNDDNMQSVLYSIDKHIENMEVKSLLGQTKARAGREANATYHTPDGHTYGSKYDNEGVINIDYSNCLDDPDKLNSYQQRNTHIWVIK